MSDRDALLKIATGMGLEFHSNIPTYKLESLIANAGKTEGENQKEKETPKKKEKSDEAPKTLRQTIKEAKDKAFATKVVTITNRDIRESSYVTTAPLSFENAYFSLAKIVPLDTPVELEQGLIDVALSSNITLHKDEIVNGKRTGNSTPVSSKKYTVSYAEAK